MLFRLLRRLGGYGREYTRFSRNAWLYLLSSFFGGLWFSVFILFFNFYLKSLRYDETTIGLLNAVPAVSSVLFALPTGFLADRIGRKRVLLGGTLITALSFVGLCLSENLPLITLLLIGSSFGQVIMWTLSAPFMTDNSRPEERTQLFSLQFALFSLTNFIGNAGGGFLPRLWSGWIGQPAETTEPLRLTLLVGGICLILSFLPLPFITERVRPRPVVSRAEREATPRRWLPRNIRLILWLVLPETLVGLGAGMTIPFLNLYINTKFGVDFEGLGLLFGFAELGTTVAVFIQPLLARRFGKVRSVVLFQGFSLPLLFMLGFAPYFWLVAIALYIRGALMNAANPVYQVFVQEQVREDERATTSAVLSVTDNLARGSGSAFSGALRGAIGTMAGFNVLFGLMIVCYIGSISVFYFRFRHTENNPDPEPALVEPALVEKV